MKDVLRPILELTVILPGLLLSYFPVKSYLKQSPGRLAAWVLPLLAGFCTAGGLICYNRRMSIVPALVLIVLFTIVHSGFPCGNPGRLYCQPVQYFHASTACPEPSAQQL